jgi:hypothetical protein
MGVKSSGKTKTPIARVYITVPFTLIMRNKCHCQVILPTSSTCFRGINKNNNEDLSVICRIIYDDAFLKTSSEYRLCLTRLKNAQ